LQAIALSIVHYERHKGHTTSGFLLVFWTALLLPSSVVLYSKVVASLLWLDDFRSSASFCVHFGLVAVNFLLVLFGVDRSHTGPIRSKSSAPPALDTSAFSNFSRLTFWYLNDLVVRGNRGDLSSADLGRIDSNCLDEELMQTVEAEWSRVSRRHLDRLHSRQDETELRPLKRAEEQATVRRPLLAWCVLRLFAGEFLAGAALKAARDVFLFLGPYVLARLIAYVEEAAPSRAVGLFWAACMSALFFAQALVFNQYFDRMFKLGARIRSALTDLLYKQSLRLSHAARRRTAAGHMTNLVAVNAQSLNEFPHYLNMAWSCLANIAVCIVLLGQILNPASAVAGFVTMLVFVPFNSVCTNLSKQKQTEKLRVQDLRLKNVSEILNGIKIIKLHAWERSYAAIVARVRAAELLILKYISLLNAVQSFSWIVSPFLVSLVAFSIFLLSSPANVLDAQTAFTALAIFNLLKQPLAMLPMTISNVIQAHVSFGRLQHFLLSETIDQDMVGHEARPGESVSLEECTFGWSRDLPVLTDISFTAPTGTLTASKREITLS